MDKIMPSRGLRNLLLAYAGDRKEYNKVALLFILFVFVLSASTTGRTVADTLFLSRFDSADLSLMYLPQAAAIFLAGVIFQRYSKQLSITSFILWLIPSITALVLVSRLGVGLELRWVYPVIYIVFDVFTFLMVLSFWQFTTEVLDQRKAKKMIVMVGAGGIVGGILSGFGLKWLVAYTGTANLLYFYVLLQLLSLVIVLLILHTHRESVVSKAKPLPQQMETRQNGLFQHVPHLKYMCIVAVSVTFTLTIIDYQFKVIAQGALQDEALASFLGMFYGFSSLIALFIQLFVTGSILTRFGVMTALLVFPLVLLLGSLGLLFFPVLAMATLAKGSDRVIGDTIYSSVFQLVMFPVSPAWRAQAKSFLDGIARNGARSLAACVLIFTASWLTPVQLSYISIGMLSVGSMAGIKIRKAYLQTLLTNLQTGTIMEEPPKLNVIDPASKRIFIEALSSPDSQQALYAFRVLREARALEQYPYLELLLQHPALEVREQALQVVQEETPPQFESILPAYIVEAKSSHLRASAILALAAYRSEAYLDELTGYLESESVVIRAAAIAGLVKYYGIEGMYRAVAELKQLLESEQEEERIAVAALFGQIGVQNFYKPLITLLADALPQVRIQALTSVAKLQVTELLEPTAELLADGKTRLQAVKALAAYNQAVIMPYLTTLLQRQHLGLYVPRVCERIGTQSAFDMLLRNYAAVRLDVRDRLLEALLRMNKAGFETDKKEIEALVWLELRLYEAYSTHGAGLIALDAGAEMATVIKELRASSARRIFQLLSLAYGMPHLQAVYTAWTEGDVSEQANATEIIDQTIRGALRLKLLGLMSTTLAVVKTPQTEGALSEHILAEHVAWLMAQNDPWLSKTVRFVVHQSSKQRGILWALLPDEADLSAGEGLLEQIERVRLLRNTVLFHGLTGRELSYIAAQLSKVTVPRGMVIIQEGEAGHSLHILEKGRVGVYHNAQKISVLGAGACFGEMSVLMTGLRTATVRAEEEAVFWELDATTLFATMFDHPSIALEMMRMLSQRLRAMQGGVEHKLSPTLVDTDIAVASEAGMDMAALPNDNASILRKLLVLQKIDIFSYLETNDYLRLAQAVEEVEYQAGESICRAGDIGDTMYGILEGSVQVHQGKEQLALLREGEAFGEMAIIENKPRSADCTAMETTRLLHIHRDHIVTLCFQNIDVMKNMLRILAERLHSAGSSPN